MTLARIDIPNVRYEIIGNCSLYLGDSRMILPQLGPVDSVVTDPPYGMGFRSNYRKTRHAKIANDSDFDALIWACSIDVRHSKYVFCRWDNLAVIPKPKSLITWIKDNWSMEDLKNEHARQTEVVAFYPGPEHYFPGRRPSDVIRARRTKNTYHPTEKPVQLMYSFVELTSGTVFDPFMGSGSTGVACMRANRPFVGIEIDERYFEVACRRIQEASGHYDMFADVRSA